MNHVTFQSIAASIKFQIGMFVTLEKSRRRLANSGLLRFTRRRLMPQFNFNYNPNWTIAQHLQEIKKESKRLILQDRIQRITHTFPQSEIYVIDSRK